MIEKKCIICSKIFLVKNYRIEKAKFCSHNCYSKSLLGTISKKRTGKYIECKRCKKEFWVQLNEEKNGRKYCSSKCYHNNPSPNIGKKYLRDSSKLRIKRGTYQKCKKCGKDFYVYPYQKNVKFCSMECSKTGKYQKCKVCGKEFYIRPCEEKRGEKYCSKKCFFEYNKGENHYSWKGGITKLAEKIRKHFKSNEWKLKIFE